jgi:putative peptidoglycan lipid II flippase
LNLLIVLPWHLSGTAGAHAGLALATALAAYLNAGLLFVMLRRQHIFEPDQAWLGYLLRIAGACLVMGGLLFAIMPDDAWWQDSRVWQRVSWLTGLIALALVSYFATLRLLGMPFRQMLGR